MADVFISYARTDKPTAARLAKALEARGWSVWWDSRIPHGTDYEALIQEELLAARCVVVLWSRASIISHFVRDEAREGLGASRLVPIVIDDATPPLGFRGLQTAALSDWDGTESGEEIERLFASIEAFAPLRADGGVRDADPATNAFDVGFAFQQGGQYDRAAEQYRVAFQHGNQDGAAYLGDMYACGYGRRQDYQQALDWFKRAWSIGVISVSRSGPAFENGYGYPTDPEFRRLFLEEALSGLRHAADAGDADAAGEAGDLLANNVGNPADHKEALRYLQLKVAQKPKPTTGAAYYEMAKLLDIGKGIKRDPARAVECLFRAVELDSYFAKLLIVGELPWSTRNQHGNGILPCIGPGIARVTKAELRRRGFYTGFDDDDFGADAIEAARALIAHLGLEVPDPCIAEWNSGCEERCS